MAEGLMNSTRNEGSALRRRFQDVGGMAGGLSQTAAPVARYQGGSPGQSAMKVTRTISDTLRNRDAGLYQFDQKLAQDQQQMNMQQQDRDEERIRRITQDTVDNNFKEKTLGLQQQQLQATNQLDRDRFGLDKDKTEFGMVQSVDQAKQGWAGIENQSAQVGNSALNNAQNNAIAMGGLINQENANNLRYGDYGKQQQALEDWARANKPNAKFYAKAADYQAAMTTFNKEYAEGKKAIKLPEDYNPSAGSQYAQQAQGGALGRASGQRQAQAGMPSQAASNPYARQQASQQPQGGALARRAMPSTPEEYQAAYEQQWSQQAQAQAPQVSQQRGPQMSPQDQQAALQYYSNNYRSGTPQEQADAASVMGWRPNDVPADPNYGKPSRLREQASRVANSVVLPGQAEPQARQPQRAYYEGMGVERSGEEPYQAPAPQKSALRQRSQTVVGNSPYDQSQQILGLAKNESNNVDPMLFAQIRGHGFPENEVMELLSNPTENAAKIEALRQHFQI